MPQTEGVRLNIFGSVYTAVMHHQYFVADLCFLECGGHALDNTADMALLIMGEA